MTTPHPEAIEAADQVTTAIWDQLVADGSRPHCTLNQQKCAEIITDAYAEVVRENELLRRRGSDCEPCHCPDFCRWHAREQHTQLTTENKRLQDERADVVRIIGGETRIGDLRPYVQSIVNDANEAGSLFEALEELMDWQNGPPLVTYEKGWNAAMEKAREALKEAGA